MQPHTKTCALFCRGKVSEGLDFSDKSGRAVVITGIPFAMAKDAKVLLKKEVLNEAARAGGSRRGQAPANRLTGDQWYMQQASRYTETTPKDEL